MTAHQWLMPTMSYSLDLQQDTISWQQVILLAARVHQLLCLLEFSATGAAMLWVRNTCTNASIYLMQRLRAMNQNVFVCLCWGLTSQSTIFQSCRDGATASWVINQYFRGVKCLAQRHNTAEVDIEPPTSRSGVRHSTTEPPCSPESKCNRIWV